MIKFAATNEWYALAAQSETEVIDISAGSSILSVSHEPIKNIKQVKKVVTSRINQKVIAEKKYWVYILHCDNNSYYTGYTTDLNRRYKDHVDGKCKYTRSFKPLSIAQSWQITSSKSEAMRVECSIKKLTKKEKTELILFPERLAKIFREVKMVSGERRS